MRGLPVRDLRINAGHRSPVWSPVSRIALVIGCGFMLVLPPVAPAGDAPMRRVAASSYGPGLFGNRMACGRVLTPWTRGVAHRSLPCGARLRVCYRRRCRIVRVVDRGPFNYARTLDLTSRTTRDLCRCTPRVWGVRRVTMQRVNRR
jgi:rare lipoprotein A (peptidoglycan hydrolase)